MFKNASYRLGSVMLIIAFIFLVGCGGSESGLDGDLTLNAEITGVFDGGDGTTSSKDIDVIQGTCGTDDPPPSDGNNGSDDNPPPSNGNNESNTVRAEKITPEPFFETRGQVTFTYDFYCPTCPPGSDQTYIIDSYTVEYIPIKSPDGHVDSFLPPKLVNLDQRMPDHTVLSRTFTTAERTIILIPFNTKAEYVNKTLASGGFPDTLYSSYTIRVTFYGRNSAGNTFSIAAERLVQFGNYDRCAQEE